jgi:hypothetical protein
LVATGKCPNVSSGCTDATYKCPNVQGKCKNVRIKQ